MLDGRNGADAAWGTTLTGMGGEPRVDDVVTYVLSLTDKSLLATNGEAVARGGKLFAGVCAACHGPDGKGNPQLGAPDLTDDYWLYGRSRGAMREGLRQGPQWRDAGARAAHRRNPRAAGRGLCVVAVACAEQQP